MSRWRQYYGDGAAEPLWDAPGVYERIAERMRDLSEMVKSLQQQFTSWYNRTRPSTRRGALWAGRFKSVALEEGDALWESARRLFFWRSRRDSEAPIGRPSGSIARTRHPCFPTDNCGREHLQIFS